MPKIPCPQCGRSLNIPEQMLGKSGRCPACQATIALKLPAQVEQMVATPGLHPPVERESVSHNVAAQPSPDPVRRGLLLFAAISVALLVLGAGAVSLFGSLRDVGLLHFSWTWVAVGTLLFVAEWRLTTLHRQRNLLFGGWAVVVAVVAIVMMYVYVTGRNSEASLRWFWWSLVGTLFYGVGLYFVSRSFGTAKAASIGYLGIASLAIVMLILVPMVGPKRPPSEIAAAEAGAPAAQVSVVQSGVQPGGKPIAGPPAKQVAARPPVAKKPLVLNRPPLRDLDDRDVGLSTVRVRVDDLPTDALTERRFREEMLEDGMTVEMRHGGGNTIFTFSPVEDVAAFAKRASFLEVKEVSVSSRSIDLRYDPIKSKELLSRPSRRAASSPATSTTGTQPTGALTALQQLCAAPGNMFRIDDLDKLHGPNATALVVVDQLPELFELRRDVFDRLEKMPGYRGRSWVDYPTSSEVVFSPVPDLQALAAQLDFAVVTGVDAAQRRIAVQFDRDLAYRMDTVERDRQTKLREKYAVRSGLPADRHAALIRSNKNRLLVIDIKNTKGGIGAERATFRLRGEREDCDYYPNGPTGEQLILFDVRDVFAFASAINYANVVDYDAQNRKLTIDLDRASPSTFDLARIPKVVPKKAPGLSADDLKQIAKEKGVDSVVLVEVTHLSHDDRPSYWALENLRVGGREVKELKVYDLKFGQAVITSPVPDLKALAESFKSFAYVTAIDETSRKITIRPDTDKMFLAIAQGKWSAKGPVIRVDVPDDD